MRDDGKVLPFLLQRFYLAYRHSRRRCDPASRRKMDGLRESVRVVADENEYVFADNSKGRARIECDTSVVSSCWSCQPDFDADKMRVGIKLVLMSLWYISLETGKFHRASAP